MPQKYYVLFLASHIVLPVLAMQDLGHDEDRVEISAAHLEKSIQEDTQNWFEQLGTRWEPNNNVTAWFSRYKDPCANGITHFAAPTEKDCIANIEAVIAHAKEQSLPFSWYVNPKNFSYNIAQLLEERGFEREPTDIMVHHLRNIKAVNDSGSSIKQIAQDEIGDWLTIFNAVFDEYDPAFTRAYADIMQKDMVTESSGCEYYAGYCNATMVSTGALCCYPECALISSITTLPAYRKRGIASSLITALLHKAKQKDLRYVFLTTSTAAALYEKVGFKKIMQLDDYTFNNKS